MICRASLFVIVTVLAGAFALSNPQDQSYTRLARLSYLEGRVSFQHGSDVDWSAASINLPIEPGDRIYTGNDGRAEIEFDDGSALRLAENTDIEFLSLREELIQVRMLLGLSTLNVLGNADFEIATPAAAFNVVREGIYRFDVIENGDTDAIVRKGELEAANNEFSRRLRSGDLLHLSPRDGGKPEISLYDRRDAWDEWNDRRNADIQVYGNQRYLPDNVYMGASELDRYGHWVNVESYGTAWVPYGVDPYWSPYSVGRWCYRPFYGWTWVSYEPWGWLPYHYGRWYSSPLYGWCWLPGPAFAFNFWSPGLVTFYSGPGWVSWCPLGPGDYYNVHNYHYHHGIYDHQIAELRKLHTRPPGNPFNRDVHGAFRTAQLEQFRDGSFNGRNNNTSTRWGNIDRPWSQGTLVRDQLTIQPTSKSFTAVSDSLAVRPSVTSTLPAVVRNVPAQESGNRGQFTQITNPQVRSVWIGKPPSRGNTATDARDSTRTNSRVIQVPQNPPAVSPANQGDRGANSPRGTASRANSGESARSGATQGSRPENPAPSRQQNQNPAKSRGERSTPERQSKPQPSPQPSPRSELRQGSGYSTVPAEVSQWRDSSPAGTRLYVFPRSGNGGRQVDSNPGITRSPETGNAQAFVMPRSESQGRWGSSGPGAMRSQDAGRAPAYIAPRPSNSYVDRSGGSRSVVTSQSHGNSGGGTGRSAPQGNAGHRR